MICTKCDNIGYYEMAFSKDATKKMQMFCVCSRGKALRTLTQEFRLADINAISRDVLPKLQKAKDNLHKPEDAGKELNEMIHDFELLLEKAENALINQ